MNPVSRRKLLGSLPAAALPPFAGQAAVSGGSGKLKITRFVTYKSSLRWRDLLFLEVHTDGGIVGLGEATCHGRVDEVEAALHLLEDRMVGLDPSGIEDHWDRINYRLTRWRSGIVLTTVLSAMDIALWDIEGKRLGAPVWRLLGGPIHRRMRAYYTHWNNTMTSRSPEAFAERAVATVEKGWTAVKFGVPEGNERERIDRTVAILAAIRKAAGNRLDVGLEFAERFTPRSALAMAQAVAEYRPMFIEEPIQRENSFAFGPLAAKSPVPIATGEGLLSRHEFRPLLEVNGASIIQPDVVKCGGITEMRKIANLAEVYNVEVAPHMCYGPVAHVASLQAACVWRNFFIHEWEADDDALFQELTPGYPVMKGGTIGLPEGPGLGISCNFAEIARRYPYKRRPA